MAVSEAEAQAPAPAPEEELIVEEAAAETSAKVPGVPGTLTLGVKERYALGPVGDGFTSKNPKVAAVGPDGTIVAKKKGRTEITVTAGGAVVGVCQLTVKPAPKKVKLPKKLTITENNLLG